jgi:hypothetical protein
MYSYKWAQFLLPFSENGKDARCAYFGRPIGWSLLPGRASLCFESAGTVEQINDSE